MFSRWHKCFQLISSNADVRMTQHSVHNRATQKDGTERFIYFIKETKTIRLSPTRPSECGHDHGVCVQFPLSWLSQRV